MINGHPIRCVWSYTVLSSTAKVNCE